MHGEDVAPVALQLCRIGHRRHGSSGVESADMWYHHAMKRSTPSKARRTQALFVKRMAKIVFETNVRQKGNAKASINVADFCLSADDHGVYTQLVANFFREGESVISKSAAEIAEVIPPAVFQDALPRLVKAGALSVSFWEHRASSPNLWRRVPNF